MEAQKIAVDAKVALTDCDRDTVAGLISSASGTPND